MRASKLTSCTDTRVYRETYVIGLAGDNRDGGYSVFAEVSLNTSKSDFGFNTTFNSIDNKLYNIDDIEIELFYGCYEDSYIFGKIRLKPIADTRAIHITPIAFSQDTFSRLVYTFKDLIERKARGERPFIPIIGILKHIIYCLLDDEAETKYDGRDILTLVGRSVCKISKSENMEVIFDCPILEESPHFDYLSPIYKDCFSEKDREEYDKGINFNLPSKIRGIGTCIKAKKDK